MSLKGINPIEKIADKVVFGIFFLLLLGVLVLQFIGSPNAVTVGGQKVRPDQASQIIKGKAEQKLAQLKSDVVAEELQRTPPSLVDRFAGALEQVGSSSGQLVALGAPTVVRGDVDRPTGGIATEIPDEARFAAVSLPAPSKPLAGPVELTLDPMYVNRHLSALPDWLTERQPYDIRCASVQTSLSSAAIMQAMNNPGEGASPVPPQWWEGRVEILDVQLFRQEMVIEGMWSEPEFVPPPPHVVTLAAKVHGEPIAPAQLRELLDQERAARQSIRTPPFCPQIAGEPWRTPQQMEQILASVREVKADNPEAERLLRQLAQIRGEIQRIERSLDPARQSSRRHDSSNDQGSGRERYTAGGGRPGSPPGGRDQRRPSNEDAQRERAAQREAAARQRLDALKKEESDILSRLKGMGIEPGQEQKHTFPAPEPPPAPTPLLDSSAGSVTIWAHDITAQPGHTYRYQFVIWVTNPYFGNGNQLADDQQELANALAIATPASEWSDPIRIIEPVQYFLNDSRVAQTGIVGSAAASIDADVYRFFYGYWRKQTVRAEPGDPIAGVIDVSSFEGFEVTQAQPGQPAARTALEITKLPASTGAFLLETAEPMGSDQRSAIAYIGVEAGGVELRSPDMDRSTGVRAWLEASVEAGTSATIGEPGAVAPAGGPAQPPPPPDGDEPGGLGRDRSRF